MGDRAGNFAVQNCDFLLVLGCRLNIRQISYNWDSFARAAFKVMVDIDKAELGKPTLTRSTCRSTPTSTPFSMRLRRGSTATCLQRGPRRKYLEWCRERLERYPVVLPAYWDAARTA